MKIVTEKDGSKWIELEGLIKAIKELKNPYPPDIFSHTSKNKLDITIGRFNEHCYNQIEWTKKKIIEMIEDEL